MIPSLIPQNEQLLLQCPFCGIKTTHSKILAKIHSILLSTNIGLCSSQNQLKSQIILAGDPKQLDAACKSKFAAELGYKTSLMERLFNRRLYRKDQITDTYNPKYITQLIRNYRSHAAILHAPNRLFYEGTLQATASKGLFIDEYLHFAITTIYWTIYSS